LYGKLSKCSFYQSNIHYSGHAISDEAIAVDPTKVEAIMEWPVPMNVTELCSLMGLSGILSVVRRGFFKDRKSDYKIAEEEQEICLE
jgi:hypothetical protein